MLKRKKKITSLDPVRAKDMTSPFIPRVIFFKILALCFPLIFLKLFITFTMFVITFVTVEKIEEIILLQTQVNVLSGI